MILSKWRKYSYAAQKKERHRLAKALLWLFGVFAVFSLISGMVCRAVAVENAAMRPGVHVGDRLLALSWGMAGGLTVLDKNAAASVVRGDLVLISPAGEPGGWLYRSVDALVRFFTAQRRSLSGEPSELLLKRVIGLPGDEVAMDDFVFRIRPRGENYALTEFELTARPYDTAVDGVPEGWAGDLPLSGAMPPAVVPDDAYFVVSDYRAASNDSRSWGAVDRRRLIGKVFFRYWPPGRFGPL